MHNIHSAKLFGQQSKRVWKEFKEGGSETGGRWREEAQKLNASTILTYMNALLRDSFLGTKEIIV